MPALPAFLRRSAPQPLPEFFEIEGRALPLRVREHAGARRLVLRLSPSGELRVTVPPRTRAATVLGFLDRHRAWVAGRLEVHPGAVRVEDGAILPFRGGELLVVHEPGRRAARVEAGEGRLLVGGERDGIGRRVADTLKREARRDLQAEVDRLVPILGLRPSALSLKDTRSRWGSCSAERRLSFSWRIVMAPPPVLRYLVAHEMAHLREMNHAPAFWALCRELCPETEAGRDWLRRRGGSLHAIDFG
ncbi:M48 family metallopeptidase [Aureimonas sp. AU4]|uniref:M48 family metallopeptidase n=1 Tax=Aureimonas sp. AU4 TaxID=1638163 RepID=UPI0007853DED|nr:SprT family zinc-dependent metalloprotease [Aureimonas sp. AU4]